jgi:hypothetical protein
LRRTYPRSHPALSLSIVGHPDLARDNHGARIAVDRRAPRLGNVPRRWICQVRIAPMSEQRLQIPGIGALGKL